MGSSLDLARFKRCAVAFASVFGIGIGVLLFAAAAGRANSGEVVRGLLYSLFFALVIPAAEYWPSVRRYYGRIRPSARVKLDQVRDALLILVVTITIVTLYDTVSPTHSETEKHLVEAGIVFVAIIGGLATIVFRLRMFIWDLFEIRLHAEGPIGRAMIPYAKSTLSQLNSTVQGILQPDGAELGTSEAQAITQLCFEAANAAYDGTDSNVPSAFKRRYPGYLIAHGRSLERLRTQGLPAPSRRILIVERAHLFRDARENPTDYAEFVAWHAENSVSLLFEDPAHAQRIAAKYGLPSTDVGIWAGQYAMLFSPQQNGKVRLSMESAPDEEERYTNIVRYFAELHEHAKDNLVPNDPDLLGKTLSVNWENFVRCDERLRSEGPFLQDVLGAPTSAPVLDAATGAGCESVFLREKGYLVISNEIEDELADLALTRAKSRGLSLIRTAEDWQDLERAFSTPHFAAVLVLGNSLCLVQDKDARKRCIEQFFKVLQPGGKLVIDERNFSYILDNASEIRKNPVKNFRYSRKVMYCGNDVRGVPKDISPERVTFLYYNNPLAVNLYEANASKIGDLEMYPFKKGELRALLYEMGFEKVETFSDFKEGEDPDADFFIYVAQKSPVQPATAAAETRRIIPSARPVLPRRFVTNVAAQRTVRGPRSGQPEGYRP